jgi:hypothetical protein
MVYGPLAALPTAGLIPAAFQAIIAKEPCIAWLPKINDATTINHINIRYCIVAVA